MSPDVNRNKGVGKKAPLIRYISNAHVFIPRMISTIIIFVSAALATNVICGLLKLASGELRPNFLAVCQPDTRIFDCRDGYITNASVCTGDLLKVKNAR